MAPNFDPTAFEFQPWSMSKMRVALDCSLRFKLKYVDRVKPKATEISSSQRIGSAAHQAIELVLQGVPLRESMRRAMIRYKLTTVEGDELLALFYNIEGFLKNLESFKKAHLVTEQHIEHHFALTADLTPCEYGHESAFLRGIWDLCLRAHDKYIIIIDHKTGEDHGIAPYELQLKLYALAGLYVFPGVEGVQAALNYIENEPGENTRWMPMLTRAAIEQDLVPWFEKSMNTAARMAKGDTAREGVWCRFCEYVHVCPLKRG